MVLLRLLFDAFVVFGMLSFGVLGLRVVDLGCSVVLMRVLFVFVVPCFVLGSWLLVFGVSHS